jgi:hypothetical protein
MAIVFQDTFAALNPDFWRFQNLGGDGNNNAFHTQGSVQLYTENNSASIADFIINSNDYPRFRFNPEITQVRNRFFSYDVLSMDPTSSVAMLVTDDTNYIIVLAVGADNIGALFYYDNATLQFVEGFLQLGEFPLSIGMFFQDDYWGAVTKSQSDIYWNPALVLPAREWPDLEILPPDTVPSGLFFSAIDAGNLRIDNFEIRTDNPLRTPQSSNFRGEYISNINFNGSNPSRSFMLPGV